MSMFLNFKAGQTSENVHYWLGTNDYLMIDLQFVDYKGIIPLKSFKDYDQAINWLWLQGFKSSASELNKLIKEAQE